MTRSMKGSLVTTAVLAMLGAASPLQAACPFLNGSRITQGTGIGGVGAGGVLTDTLGTVPVDGFPFTTHDGGLFAWFWEVDFGDNTIGAGNDQGTRFNNEGGIDGDSIARDAALPRIEFDWQNSGVDGCLSGHPISGAGAGVMAVYFLDDNDEYAIGIVTGEDLGGGNDRHDFDFLQTGIGGNGNDVPMGPRVLKPIVSDIVIVDSSTIMATVAPVAQGLNVFDDGNGPYPTIVDISAISGVCPDHQGCGPLTLPRFGSELCYTGNAVVVGQVVPGSCMCVGGATFCGGVCGPCCLGTAGTEETGPPSTVPMGMEIPGGCLVFPNIVDDHAVARALKQKGFWKFTWEATQFGASHWNILDVTKGERRVNDRAIPRHGDLDGSTVAYEYVATGKQIRGGKRFELELILADGESVRFPID